MPKQKIISVPIDSIVTSERIRHELRDMEQLALSIQRHGLFTPIVVTVSPPEGPDDKNCWLLIAGGRRVAAARYLKWESIDAILLDDLDEFQRLELELEENIQRSQLEWTDEIEAERRLHELKQELYGKALPGSDKGGWREQDTATSIGVHQSTIHRDIELARAFEVYPELKKESSKHKAQQKLKLIKEHALRSELARRQIEAQSSDKCVIKTDCRKYLVKRPDASIGAIMTDPPFGISLDESGVSEAHGQEAYSSSDSPEDVMGLMVEIIPHFFRTLIDGGHLFMFFGWDHFNFLYNELLDAGFSVDPVPGIWNKKSGALPHPYRLSASHEGFLHAWKGSRPLVKSIPNVLSFPRVHVTKRLHLAEKPVALWTTLIKASTPEGSLVYDPFSGSGAALEAAFKSGCTAIGTEIDDRYVNASRIRIAGVLAELIGQ